MGWPITIELCSMNRLYLCWHMPDDTAEPVAEHYVARLQPSINLGHAPVTAFLFSCSGTQCTTFPKG